MRHSLCSALLRPGGIAWTAAQTGAARHSTAPARGDLHNFNPLNTTLNNRQIGAHRGLQYASQATSPQSGQLHLRKHMLHAMGGRVDSGSAALRPARASWGYLIPSLRAGVEAALPDGDYAALRQRQHQEPTEGVAARVREAQRWFGYELHRRLPLLEDSLAAAELRDLVGWLSLFQRAGLALPAEAAATAASAPSDQTSSNGSSSGGRAMIAVGNDLVLRCQVALNSSDAARVARLTTEVVAAVTLELQAAGSGGDEAGGRSRREEAAHAALCREWEEAVAWHGLHV